MKPSPTTIKSPFQMAVADVQPGQVAVADVSFDLGGLDNA